MARPEGEWVIVSWTTAREGQTQLGDAGQRLERFTPTCDEGPCDIEVTPGGVDGTYLPEGITPAEGQDPSTEPSTLVWDEASGTYTRQIERLSSCTTESGVVPDGYMVTSTGTFTFVPPHRGRACPSGGDAGADGRRNSGGPAPGVHGLPVLVLDRR